MAPPPPPPPGHPPPPQEAQQDTVAGFEAYMEQAMARDWAANKRQLFGLIAPQAGLAGGGGGGFGDGAQQPLIGRVPGVHGCTPWGWWVGRPRGEPEPSWCSKPPGPSSSPMLVAAYGAVPGGGLTRLDSWVVVAASRAAMPPMRLPPSHGGHTRPSGTISCVQLAGAALTLRRTGTGTGSGATQPLTAAPCHPPPLHLATPPLCPRAHA